MPLPLTEAEQAALARKLAADPEMLDRFLLDLLEIARDAARDQNP